MQGTDDRTASTQFGMVRHHGEAQVWSVVGYACFRQAKARPNTATQTTDRSSGVCRGWLVPVKRDNSPQPYLSRLKEGASNRPFSFFRDVPAVLVLASADEPHKELALLGFTHTVVHESPVTDAGCGHNVCLLRGSQATSCSMYSLAGVSL
jgi:hypothetical protein